MQLTKDNVFKKKNGLPKNHRNFHDVKLNYLSFKTDQIFKLIALSY